ncbi:hypothetical protein EGR_09867 [Echinococcus granulosus]|uniref:PH domain-containing protein n=1 Tax=Echinococcus granulosus TaxID=6210 RepID=W6U3V1_ECHGR|nr:hypothetical protein EGR_09867 [Echinococcus granulosus]EUB55266.1 hypothetical protein EGR_09867 [Echinococcus granulosus]
MFALSVDPLQPGWFSAKFYTVVGHDVPKRQVLDGFLQCGKTSKIRASHNASTQVVPALPSSPESPSSSPTLSSSNQHIFESVKKVRLKEVVDANRHERVGVRIVRSHSASRELCRTYTKSQQTATFLVYTRDRWYLCRQRSGCSPKMICEVNRMMFNSSTQVQEDEITSLRDVEVQTLGTYEEVMIDYKITKSKRMQNRACGDDSSCTTVVTVEDVDVEGDMETCEVTVEADRRSELSRTAFTTSETLDQITTDSAFSTKPMKETKNTRRLPRKTPRSNCRTRPSESMCVTTDSTLRKYSDVEFNSSCTCTDCQLVLGGVPAHICWVMYSVLKEGSLEKWSDGKKAFCPVYAKLLGNGCFQWFDSKSSSTPKRSLDVKAVSSFLAFGPVLNQVPCKPSAFSESDIERSFGVPHEANQRTAVSFFRCSSQAEMASWMDSVNRLLFGNMATNPGITPQQTCPVQSGPYQPYGPPAGATPFQPAMAAPPLPPGFATYPGPTQPPPYAQPPTAPPMGAPYLQSQPMQPAPGAPYGAYPTTSQPVAGSSYNYYPPPQPPAPGQQPQVLYDKNGKPYTIVYKNGKPKKKKWKKAAAGIAAGAATGYVAGKMLGGLGRVFGYGLGGWGGGWGRPCHSGWGSWSSLSSFSSSD